MLTKLLTASLAVASVMADCSWIGGKYGSLVTCPGGQVMSGVCGSGKNADCGNKQYFYMIQCCDINSSTERYNCEVGHSKYGKTTSCQSGQFAYGGCGSGYQADCKHTDTKDFNELQCCDNDSLNSAGGSCLTLYAGYGEQEACPFGYAVTEACGSGMWQDCSGSVVKFTCCPYVAN